MIVRSETPLSRTICILALEIQKTTDRILKSYNVTTEQLWVLKSLSTSNGGLTQKEICQKSSKKPANITGIIERLKRKPLVIQQASTNDRRACILTLTEQGRSLLQKTDVIFEHFSSRFSVGINSISLNATKQALNTMSDNLVGISEELHRKEEGQ